MSPVHVVVRQVLESSVVDFVITSFVLDLVAAVLVDWNAFDFAEAEFFTGLKVFDNLILGGLDVANHGVRKNRHV